MSRLFAGVLCALLLLVVLPSTARAEKDTFQFQVGGESDHWVVWLDGFGYRESGEVKYVHVRPVVSWAGGTAAPRQFRVTFRIAGSDRGTVKVAVKDPARHMIIMGVWKLVYPGMPSIEGEGPSDFVRAIRESGEIDFEWEGQKETIQWQYSNPAPGSPSQ